MQICVPVYTGFTTKNPLGQFCQPYISEYVLSAIHAPLLSATTHGYELVK